MKHSFTVSSDQADRRFDRVLRGLYPEVPLGAIMRAIRKGEARIDGRKTGLDHRLYQGEVVSVPWPLGPEGESHDRVPTDETPRGKLPVLFRSRDLLCVDKPAGLLSQPDRANGDSLITRVWRELSWSRNDFRPATISRLDRNVSGVVAVALNAPVLRLLSSLMREGAIRKKYVAIVSGDPPDEGEIDLPLLKDGGRNIVAVDRSGQASRTRYRTLRRYDGRSLVELELITGRPHQARVHLAAIGHPILGDAKYGKGGERGWKSRLFLHAISLSFPNSADLPDDLGCTIIDTPLPQEFTNFSGVQALV